MKHPFFCALALFGFASIANAADDSSKPGTWVDPEKALAEHSDFAVQGEYSGEKDGAQVGVQAAAMNAGKFLVSTYQGGLPGADWDRSPVSSQVLELDALADYVDGLSKIDRESPTLGKEAPEGTAVHFNGESNDTIKGKIKDGYLWAGSQTNVPVGDFTMHLEFRLPYKPATLPSNQDRGNSGVYIYNNYECQVLDSFALNLVEEANPFPTKSRNKQWCGSFYKFKLPDTPMT
ncbi:MAG: family 16 glycoside hydrolase, partial [Verrucomicrobiota bacterium]